MFLEQDDDYHRTGGVCRVKTWPSITTHQMEVFDALEWCCNQIGSLIA